MNGGLPVLVALGVEQGDFVGNVHQLGDLLRGELAQGVHQLCGVVEQRRGGIEFGGEFVAFVEIFGGGKQEIHGGFLLGLGMVFVRGRAYLRQPENRMPPTGWLRMDFQAA